MWTEKEEKDFKGLLEKFRLDPTQIPSESEINLVTDLMSAYRGTLPPPGAEVVYYQKITELLNIFLDEFLRLHPNILSNYNTLKDSDFLPLSNSFPLLKILEKNVIAQQRIDYAAARTAYTNFMKPSVKGALSWNESSSMNLYGGVNHPYASPEPNPQEVATKSYADLAHTLYKTAEAKHGSELKLEKERNDLINYYYRSKYSDALSALISLVYNRLDYLAIRAVPHISYEKSNQLMLYPASVAADILPHRAFEDILKLTFHEARVNPDAPIRTDFAVLALGKVIAENKEFKDFTVIRKLTGADPGFILASGDKKFYAKCTANTISEYFCAQALSHLGIKMPESKLEVDQYGNAFILTLDLSRKYTKENYLKTKSFTPLKDILDVVAPKVAFGIKAEEGGLVQPSLEQQEKSVLGFLEMAMDSSESRVSYAKILLAELAFGLSDVTAHGGNVGIVHTEKGSKKYKKFGIVDFNFKPKDITAQTDILEFLKDKMANDRNIMPIFKIMFDKISKEDFLIAAQELAQPKARTYHEGLLLMSSPVSHQEAGSVINQTYSALARELQGKISPDEYKAVTEKLVREKDMMMLNINHLTRQVIAKLTPLVDGEKKREKADIPPLPDQGNTPN